MKDAIRFFQQYESVIYFFLAIGIVVYGWRFYSAWQEMRGSVFGLEQVGAQRRLNRSALAIFVILLLGIGVFSLITFAQPILDSTDFSGNFLDIPGSSSEISGAGGAPDGQSTLDVLVTATPLPTVAIDPALCQADAIIITSPVANEEVRGVIEIRGIVNVDDFGAYIIELAKAEEALWLPIQANRSLVIEEGILMEWDSSLTPPGNYVLQLRVTTHDGEEYEPCRIPIRVGNP